jgi:hypothetical protein
MASMVRAIIAPQNWADHIRIKDVAGKDEKLGYIDTVIRGTTFEFLGAREEPVSVGKVRTPYECFTVDECLGKGRGKLTVRLQLNARMWTSLSNLDGIFKAFLIRNRTKLFNSSDADYIGRDNSAIALKYKDLAPVHADGSPQNDAYITVRINGRASEIEAIETKSGSSGRYVSGVTWQNRTSPLMLGSTRISLVTGKMASGTPTIADTLPLSGVIPVGSSRVRYVGPGEIVEGSMLRYAALRPAYWSVAPGGGASITLVADHLIVEKSSGEGSAVAQDYSSVPAGFSVDSSEIALPLPKGLGGMGLGLHIDTGPSPRAEAFRAEVSAAAAAGGGDGSPPRGSNGAVLSNYGVTADEGAGERAVPPAPKKQRTALRRAAAIGPSAAESQRDYEARIAEEHERMNQNSQYPSAADVLDDEAY